MARYLSPEWFAAGLAVGGALPERPGVSAVVDHVVGGGPDGEVRYVTRVVDGRVVQHEPGSADEPDATLTVPHAEGLAIATGELDVNAAFMQGRIKTAGRTGPLLHILAVLQDPAWAEVTATTEA
ncbi:MAG: alkyl sulfatase C-terminal domain-containing protein [Acidimicrobiales bacterium]